MTKLISLKSDSRFKSLLSKKKIHTDYFTIYFGKILESENNNALIISFVIKKKIGNSVIRNRIKRRLQSVIRKNLQDKKNINTNYSYLVFGKSRAYDEKYSIIEEEFNKTFFKINALKN